MTKNISLNIEGTWNDRDVSSITKINTNTIFRSANLDNLSNSGVTELVKLGVTDVIDLRGSDRIKDHNKSLLDAFTFHHTPIDMGEMASMQQIFRLKNTDHQSLDGAYKHMQNVYTNLINNSSTSRQFIKALRIIKQSKGATLIHCTAGKDRTGVLVAIILLILGIDQSLILDDYMHSNYSTETLQKYMQQSNGFIIPKEVLDVKPEYLQASIDQINNRFGGIDEFLIKNGFSLQEKNQLLVKFID